jgi:hypothetical protein
VEPPELLGRLVELAAEAGIRVRAAQPAGSLESGVCRVRGELWLILVPADPLDHRIRVVADALRTHAPAFLESRWLPPALRSVLEGEL